ncbi:Jerky [Araneus ventricosus]|uniref:Jerky n=1 Tax=Araneus ventricosus TaxID=182803 RepID=A0A4Y2B1T4_ARAVE|nr:Jerky [Araneus ventricosus]
MGERNIIRHSKTGYHDQVMIKWVRQRRSEGVPLSGPLLMEQAKIFDRSMNLTADTSYKTGWLTKFKIRHGMRQLKICGDRESADAEASEDFANEFLSLIEAEKLSPEQIYNAEETGLFWRYVPRTTLATAGEKDPKIILYNCTAHLSPEISVKDNVPVLFFPPNCTYLIQSMDMGILRVLKCRYKSEFLKEMLSFLNAEEKLQNFLNVKTSKI